MDAQYPSQYPMHFQLVGELSTRSAEFRLYWASHDVRFHVSGIKRSASERALRLLDSWAATPDPAGATPAADEA